MNNATLTLGLTGTIVQAYLILLCQQADFFGKLWEKNHGVTQSATHAMLIKSWYVKV